MKVLSRSDFFLIVLTLTGFALSQPVFSILQATPEFLVIRRAQPSEVIALALVLALLVPAILFLLREVVNSFASVLSAIWQKAKLIIESGFDLLTIYFLFIVLFELYLKNIYLAAFFSVVGTYVAIYVSKIRELFRFFSIASVLFVVIFLWTTLSASFLSADLTAANSEQLKKIDKTKLKPTFVIIFDEFPLFSLLDSSEKINKERFPGFYRLSQLSTWFRNGSSVTSWTERAVPAILSGVLPSTSHVQVPSVADYPQNIFTLFSKTHRVFGYEQVTNLCPSTICPELKKPEDFSVRFGTLLSDIAVIYAHRIATESQRASLPSIDGKWQNFIELPKSESKNKKKSGKGLDLNQDYADDVILFDRFLADLEKDISNVASTGVNPLSVVHITFPHVPYRYLPDGSKYALDRDIGNDREYVAQWPKDAQGLAVTALQRFLMQAAVADKLIVKFLDVLERTNLLDKSVVAVTADHGSSFKVGEYSRRTSDNNYSDVMSVPFFISMPGLSRTGEINDKNVSSVDILPTLLSLNGLDPLADSTKLSGQSLSSDNIKEANNKTFFPLVGDQRKVVLTYPKLMDRQESIQYVSKLFGDSGFDERFYKPDFTGKNLIGKSIQEINDLIRQDISVGIHKFDKYKNLKLSPGYIPALLTGVVRYKNKQPMDNSRKTIAITMADKMVALGQTDKVKGDNATFMAFVPPYMLKNGDNQLKAVALKD